MHTKKPASGDLLRWTSAEVGNSLVRCLKKYICEFARRIAQAPSRSLVSLVSGQVMKTITVKSRAWFGTSDGDDTGGYLRSPLKGTSNVLVVFDTGGLALH